MMEYDELLVDNISRHCGSNSVRKGCHFYRLIRYHSPDNFLYHIYEDKAYYVAIANKNHVRLLGIAVRSEYQGQGIGRKLFYLLVRQAKSLAVGKITFRTPINESAQKFYDKMGCRVVGMKGDDYEMEYLIK